MKITIQPSIDQTCFEYPFAAVSAELPSDDLSSHETLHLFTQAMTAWGFTAEQVAKAIEQFGQ